MAINKNDYLDGDGNYDLKKALIDEVIDGANEFNTHKAEKMTEVLTTYNGWGGTITLTKSPHGIVEVLFDLTVGVTTNGTAIAFIPNNYKIMGRSVSIPHLNHSNGAQGLGIYIDGSGQRVAIYSLQNAATGNNIGGSCFYMSNID